MKGRKPLKTYSFSEFSKVLAKYGFQEHHRNSAHAIFINSEDKYVTVPFSNKKEINPMMTTITLQRIKNNNLKKL